MQPDLVGIFRAASGRPQGWEGLDLAVWQAIEAAGGKRWRKGDERVGSWYRELFPAGVGIGGAASQAQALARSRYRVL